MIFKPSEGDKLFASLAIKSKMDIDKAIAAYLVTGDAFLILLHMFEGQTLNIPSERRLGTENLHNIQFIEDDKRQFADYDKKQILEYKGNSYVVVAKERKFLNHYYLPVIQEKTIGDDYYGQ